MTNVILIALVSLLGIAGLIVLYLRAKNEKSDYQEIKGLTFDGLVEKVKYEINEIVNQEIVIASGEEEFNSRVRIKARLQNALKNCVYGIDSQKEIVKDLIKSILVKYLPDEDSICEIIDFRGRYISPQIKFEILMYFYKQQYGPDALTAMIEEFNLAEEHYLIEDGSMPSYAITIEDIDYVYAQKAFRMDYVSMLDVMVVLVYQRYKGFGIIDTLREMSINGFNCGTSGSIMTHLRRGNKATQWTAPRSVWLYYKGKYIHLRFLTFETEEELKRVIQLLIRYNKPGPLTEKRGYIVNTMYDKSRVVAIRPPASEYWAIFVRKFTLTDVSLEKLIIKPVARNTEFTPELEERLKSQHNIDTETIEALKKELMDFQAGPRTIELLTSGVELPGYPKGTDIVISFIKYLMIGMVTTGITGRQGSGKTTLLGAMVKYIDPKYTLRILEMAFELYLREAYPERNILTAQETQWNTAAELQDLFKKTDGAVSLVGEVAQDIIAARMLQFAQIASLFTLFTHHANRTEDLVNGLRNSVVATGNFSSMLVAAQQVVDVVRMDIHLNYTPDGYRYIERITEIIKLDEGVDYPEYDEKDPVNSMARIRREYYYRQTDRRIFKVQDIIRYDLDKHIYYTVNPPSPTLLNHMLTSMPEKFRDDFSDFILKNWRI